MLAAPGGEYTAEALEIARAELASRGGEAHVTRRIQEAPPSPDAYVAEYPSGKPLTHSYNGVGTKFYGKRDVAPDGSYIATKWFIIAHLPIWPLGSFRVRVLSKHSGLAHESVSYAADEMPLSSRQVLLTYVAAYGSLLALIALMILLG